MSSCFFSLFFFHNFGIPSSQSKEGGFVPHHQTDRSLSSLRPPRSLSSFIESNRWRICSGAGRQSASKEKGQGKKGEPSLCVSIDLFRPNVSIQSSHPCKKKKKKLRAYTRIRIDFVSSFCLRRSEVVKLDSI